jgi:hypothetical protein
MKTGTTAIGAYFSDANLAGILPDNVVYPSRELWFPSAGRITKHNQLGGDFLNDKPSAQDFGRKTEVSTPAEIEAKVAEVARYAANLGASNPTVVFVSETVAGRDKAPQLIEMFTRYFDDITMVISVRSPIAAVSSLLVHRVKDWRVDQLDLDLHKLLVGENKIDGFNYERILNRWSAHPDVTVALVPYFEDEADGYAVVDRFMNVINGSDAPRLDDDFGSRRIHPSLPLASLNRLIALKKVDRRFGRIPFVSPVVKKIFTRVLFEDRHKAVRSGFGARSAERGDWVLSPAERESVRAIYASSFSALKKALGAQANSEEWARWFAAEAE